MENPVWPVIELDLAIPEMSRCDSVMFFRRHMDQSLGKIGQATSMVWIAMGEDDIGHIGGLKPELFHLARGGQPFMKLKPGAIDEIFSNPLERQCDVLQTNPSIDECQSTPIFKQ